MKKSEANKEIHFRTRYDRTQDDGISFDPEDTFVKQYFKDECDINNILNRFEKTGILPDLIKQNPQYGDFSELPDYQQAIELVQKAQEQFTSLSAKIRDRFENDPAKFLEFATDPKNIDEMVTLGLATKIEPDVPEEPVDPAPKN